MNIVKVPPRFAPTIQPAEGSESVAQDPIGAAITTLVQQFQALDEAASTHDRTATLEDALELACESLLKQFEEERPGQARSPEVQLRHLDHLVRELTPLATCSSAAANGVFRWLIVKIACKSGQLRFPPHGSEADRQSQLRRTLDDLYARAKPGPQESSSLAERVILAHVSLLENLDKGWKRTALLHHCLNLHEDEFGQDRSRQSPLAETMQKIAEEAARGYVNHDMNTYARPSQVDRLKARILDCMSFQWSRLPQVVAEDPDEENEIRRMEGLGAAGIRELGLDMSLLDKRDFARLSSLYLANAFPAEAVALARISQREDLRQELDGKLIATAAVSQREPESIVLSFLDASVQETLSAVEHIEFANDALKAFDSLQATGASPHEVGLAAETAISAVFDRIIYGKENLSVAQFDQQAKKCLDIAAAAFGEARPEGVMRMLEGVLRHRQFAIPAMG